MVEYAIVSYMEKNGVIDIPKKAIPLTLRQERNIVICLLPIEHKR